VGNEVNKIFEQLPTFKANRQKEKPKDNLLHPKVKNIILKTNVVLPHSRSPDSSQRTTTTFRDQPPTTTSGSLTGTSPPSTATTTSPSMCTKRGPLIINLMSRCRLLTAAIDLSVVVLLAGCVAAMLQEVVSSAGGETEMTAVLTEANFEQYKAKQDGMLVEFFVSWCGHCKRFTTEFSEAAALAKKQQLKVIFGLLNAEDFPSLTSRFKVQSFPSLRLFKGDTMIDYEGPRMAANIVNWTLTKMNYHPEIVTIEEFNEIIENESLVLAFFGPQDQEFEQFKEFGRTLDGIRMLHVNYKKPGNRINAKIWPPNTKYSIALFRNQGQRVIVFSDKQLTIGSLSRFLESNRYPLISSLNTDDAIDRVFHRNGLNIIFFIENSKDPFQNKFIQIAKSSEQKANFFLVRKEDRYSTEVRQFLAIGHQAYRQLWAIEVSVNGVEAYCLNKTITARHIHRFLYRLKSGRIGPGSSDYNKETFVIDLSTSDGRKRLQQKKKTLVVFNFKGSMCSKRPSCLTKMRRFKGFAEELHWKPSIEFCILDFDKRYRVSKGKFYHQFRAEMPVLTLSGGTMPESIIIQDFDWRYRTLEKLLSRLIDNKSRLESRSKL
jgi:thiol-disulfide isomerase/thioredoxin